MFRKKTYGVQLQVYLHFMCNANFNYRLVLLVEMLNSPFKFCTTCSIKCILERTQHTVMERDNHTSDLEAANETQSKS